MTLRPARLDDAAAVAEIASRHWPEPIDADWVRRWWTSPRIDLDRDSRVAPEAYAVIEPPADGKAFLSLGGEVAGELVTWAQKRARERGAARLFSGAWSENEPVKAALVRAGFRLVRHSYRMRIDLAPEPEVPVWPEGMSVRTFRAGDERTFYEVHQETFEDSWEHSREPYDEWAHWLLESPLFDPRLWFLAEEGGEPAGVAICSRHYSAADLGWVVILGVRRPWRRRGLGRALLLHAFRAFRDHGFHGAGLGVDAQSLTGAHRLYESVGMNVVHRFDLYEKPLR